MKTVYVSIGNSDDKLTQDEWAAFLIEVERAVRRWGGWIHGVWYSAPVSSWQNACFCFEIHNEWAEERQVQELRGIARKYRQDSIAWAEVGTMRFLEPADES